MLRRPIVSICLICHLTALAVSAVPDPHELRLAASVRESPEDALSSHIRPGLDAAAAFLEDLTNRMWRFTCLVRPFAGRYVERLGLVQGWRMFANPPQGTEYLRFRYYSQPGEGGPLMVATELVFPVIPETENRIARAYWQAHRDKAISNALIAYFRLRMDRTETGRPVPAAGDRALDTALARSFVPVVQFFSGQYARTHLAVGDRLVRTEAWYGLAKSRLRGDVPVSPQSHTAAIERYYREQGTKSVSQSVFQLIDSIEREADVLWLLIYIQVP